MVMHSRTIQQLSHCSLFFEVDQLPEQIRDKNDSSQSKWMPIFLANNDCHRLLAAFFVPLQLGFQPGSEVFKVPSLCVRMTA